MICGNRNQIFTEEIINLDQLKQIYRQLALQYHPDRPGGDTEIMKQINLEYEALRKKLLRLPPKKETSAKEQPKTKAKAKPKQRKPRQAKDKRQNTPISEEALDAWRAVKDLATEAGRIAINIDANGEVWCWGTNTYTHRERLKAWGFWWQPDERKWRFVRKPGTSATGRASRKGGVA
jgi:hypothetical protein